jgi:hypothetical protein
MRNPAVPQDGDSAAPEGFAEIPHSRHGGFADFLKC